MEGKNYANLVRQIFGPQVLSEDQELNQNQELADAVDRLLENAWYSPEMEHRFVVDFLLEGKGKAEFEEYIREHADELATHYAALALRYLRHPKHSQQLCPYIKFRED